MWRKRYHKLVTQNSTAIGRVAESSEVEEEEEGTPAIATVVEFSENDQEGEETPSDGEEPALMVPGGWGAVVPPDNFDIPVNIPASLAPDQSSQPATPVPFDMPEEADVSTSLEDVHAEDQCDGRPIWRYTLPARRLMEMLRELHQARSITMATTGHKDEYKLTFAHIQGVRILTIQQKVRMPEKKSGGSAINALKALVKEKRVHQSKANRKAKPIQKDNERINPFELQFSRTKHDVVGRKTKGTLGKPLQKRKMAEETRKKTLAIELSNRSRTGKFVDRRIGENDPTMSLEDKMLQRFMQEKRVCLDRI
ncbi:nucleolar complex protein 14 [Phlyctochytrium bullatum]|nr:nucleolar complex protein 14 [Phlyctochytrium bullatum]